MVHSLENNNKQTWHKVILLIISYLITQCILTKTNAYSTMENSCTLRIEKSMNAYIVAVLWSEYWQKRLEKGVWLVSREYHM